jgi:phosphodiesterase/alkaline phosphatase D-like protein
MMAEGDDPAALSSSAALTGTVWAEAGHDWIAKLDVTGLKAGTSYVYGFTAAGKSSPIGHGKTAPPPGWMGTLTYADFACSRWENGWFHSYDVAAHVKNLDLWVHTGDYICEWRTQRYLSKDPTHHLLGPSPCPSHKRRPPQPPPSPRASRSALAQMSTAAISSVATSRSSRRGRL